MFRKFIGGKQKDVLQHTNPMLEESVSSTKIIHTKTYSIAELGCSSGSNALFPIETIVKAVTRKYASEGVDLPDFQAFFNDLPSNDFNSLFRGLPAVMAVNVVDGSLTPASGNVRSYFAAGVPGSFHRRLFPRASIHFVHSSYSLHWLSQVPTEVQDRKSEAWNKGQIFLTKDSPRAVVEAYSGQFQKDFSAFLRARAQEMVPRGRMVLLLRGRTSSDPREQNDSIFWKMLASAFNDMVSEGLVEQQKVDSFNLPLFISSTVEVRKEVAKEGSFTIQQLEIIKTSLSKVEEEMSKDGEAYGRLFSKLARALFESMIEFHFGGEIMVELFDRFAQKAASM
eukprot:Gb_30513 [translate_table: standard]